MPYLQEEVMYDINMIVNQQTNDDLEAHAVMNLVDNIGQYDVAEGINY